MGAAMHHGHEQTDPVLGTGGCGVLGDDCAVRYPRNFFVEQGLAQFHEPFAAPVQGRQQLQCSRGVESLGQPEFLAGWRCTGSIERRHDGLGHQMEPTTDFQEVVGVGSGLLHGAAFRHQHAIGSFLDGLAVQELLEHGVPRNIAGMLAD